MIYKYNTVRGEEQAEVRVTGLETSAYLITLNTLFTSSSSPLSKSSAYSS
jgi:hypothetical protein